jgi:hypothetical protein
LASLLDQVHAQLGGSRLTQLSQQLGIDEQQTQQALPAALAALTGAMAQNTAQPQGAEQLANALSQNHDGSILDSLDGFLGSGNTGTGFSILRHLLGGPQPAVERGLGRATGLDPATMARLLALLAPIVLGVLGRRQRQQGLDSRGLADVLGQERQHIEANPQARKGLGAVLDANGDGHIVDDVAHLLGGALGGRR